MNIKPGQKVTIDLHVLSEVFDNILTYGKIKRGPGRKLYIVDDSGQPVYINGKNATVSYINTLEDVYYESEVDGEPTEFILTKEEVEAKPVIAKKMYLIVGETGSGKDTLASMICDRMGLKKVVSYTDAPIRSDQQEGREHYFKSSEEFSRILREETVMAYTKIGKTGFRYCATVEALHENDKIYIIDPNGIADLKSRNIKDVQFKVIYINVPEDIRRRRTAARQNFDFDTRIQNESEQFMTFKMQQDWDAIIDNSSDDIELAYKQLSDYIAKSEVIR